eukprot:363917-Chlamydomonas_euryale.AAC.15
MRCEAPPCDVRRRHAMAVHSPAALSQRRWPSQLPGERSQLCPTRKLVGELRVHTFAAVSDWSTTRSSSERPHSFAGPASWSARCAAAVTALMNAHRTPAFSSSCTAAMVVPAGEVTITILAEPSTVCGGKAAGWGGVDGQSRLVGWLGNPTRSGRHGCPEPPWLGRAPPASEAAAGWWVGGDRSSAWQQEARAEGHNAGAGARAEGDDGKGGGGQELRDTMGRGRQEPGKR